VDITEILAIAVAVEQWRGLRCCSGQIQWRLFRDGGRGTLRYLLKLWTVWWGSMEVIPFTCAICGHAMKFAADKAGRKAKCPKCETIITVPKPEANGGAPKDEGDGEYGVVIDKELETRRQELAEAERIRLKELKKKKAPKIQKKFKSLPDAELWEKVHFGMLFIFLGSCVWALSHLLQGTWVALGSVEHHDLAKMFVDQIELQNPVIPERGQFWEFSQYHCLVAIAAGRGFAIFAKICLAVNMILYPIQAILWFVGYLLCLPVPRHHGTLGQLIAMMVLGFVNLMFFIFFRVLPTAGVYRFYVIPYFIPEVMITEYNMERVYPLFMLWSPSPFWESILAIFLQFIYYLQPLMGCIFIWSCATTLKTSRMEDRANAVAQVGLGQYFFWLAFLLIALCGTTPVLVTTLRVLYICWYSFLMMFIVRYTLLNWGFRELLDSRLNPEAS
jgi:hypothetical protein